MYYDYFMKYNIQDNALCMPSVYCIGIYYPLLNICISLLASVLQCCNVFFYIKQKIYCWKYIFVL